MTERQTEAWLELETREISMPDGERRAFTGFKLMWAAFDFLLVCAHYTAAEVVELALMDCREMGYSFEASFPNVIAYAEHVARKKMGFD